MMFYEGMKAMVYSPDGDTAFFKIIAGVLQGDTFVQCLFVLCLDYEFRTSIVLIKENVFVFKKKKETDDILQKLWQMLTTQMI